MEAGKEIKREVSPVITLENNPFTPPKDGACLINQLPPELLSHIFELGVREENIQDDDDEDEDEAMGELDILMGSMPPFFEVKNLKGAEDLGDDAGEGGTKSPTSSGSSDVSSEDEYEPKFQVLVSHVCKHWRTVALSTPALWTVINIGPIERSALERVQCLVERSKGLPVSIRIDCEPPDDEDSEDDADSPGGGDPKPISLNDLNALLDILVPHVQRWRTFELSVSSYELMFATLLKLSAPSVPAATHLECLQLYHHEEAETDIFPSPEYSAPLTLFGGEAPRIQTLALWGVHVNWNQNWLAGGTQLVDLELAYHTEDVRPSWAAFVRILRGSPTLETLTFSASGPAGAPEDWRAERGDVDDKDGLNDVIELPNLTDLVLAYHPVEYVSALMRKLALPSLKNLTLDLEEDDFSNFVLQLSGPAPTPSGVKRDNAPSILNGLESLKISGLPCNDRTINTMYAELNHLQALNLSMDYLVPTFFKNLSVTSAQPGAEKSKVWLPALTVLTTSGVSGPEMRELITARREAGYPLKMVFMEENDDVDPSDVEWLRENVEKFDFFEGSDDEFDLDVLGDDEDGEEGEEDEWEDMHELD
ncbi:hypothetical protein BJ138DRAFT_654227 [Hygrophoropsis aurantiaca]|uniref:Uncharacterized protein n=1 Tax=Hygrophoropsis aurantiaca TaxID=72124 RepID=A0ACB7ZZV8_9AGAM|nr:hypothetical protein BJ138DRAFT_654227 [Hygrophoropsis aurantiaca]